MSRRAWFVFLLAAASNIGCAAREVFVRREWKRKEAARTKHAIHGRTRADF